MNSATSERIRAYNDLAGGCVRQARLSMPGAGNQPMRQSAFLDRLVEALGMPARSVNWLSRMETGRETVHAAVVFAAADVAGVPLEELMAQAIHEMPYGQVLLINEVKSPRRTRIAQLLTKLRGIAEATDRPASENE